MRHSSCLPDALYFSCAVRFSKFLANLYSALASFESFVIILVKFLQLMEFIRVTRVFVATLKVSGPALTAFSFMFFVAYLAFSMAGNFLFGKHIIKFSTLINSLKECGKSIMGKCVI